MNGLHVDSVLKSFGEKQILTDVFISCQPGEIIGLLGRNGSGKSTLLKIIFGSMRAEGRFVKVGTKLIRNLYDGRDLINYLPQHAFLPGHIKIRKLIPLFCDPSSTEELLQNEYLSHFLDAKVKRLSSGERRLFEVLLMISSRAEYVLLDEPFNGIAPLHKEYIKTTIRQKSISKGFIITDHDCRNVLDIATKLILLREGNTKAIKEKGDLVFWGYIKDID